MPAISMAACTIPAERFRVRELRLEQDLLRLQTAA